MKSFIFSAFALMSTLSVVATDGWTLPPREIASPDNTKAWFAPVKDGAEAFIIEKRDGAEGDVSFTADGIRIVKMNDQGTIRVTPRLPVALMPKMRKFRGSAEVESMTEDLGNALGFVRIGHRLKNGYIGYSFKADGRALGGQGKLNRLIVTPKGRPQIKAAHFIRENGDTNDVYVAINVSGARSVSVWRNWRVDAVVEVERANAAARKGCHGRDFSSDMTDAAAFDAKLAADIDHTAKVVKNGDYAQLTVDGRAVPPILFKGGHAAGETLLFGGKRMHEAGVSLLVASVRFGTSANMENSWTTNGFNVAKAVGEVRRSMLVAPDALYVVTVLLNAPAGWCDVHTNEIWRTEKGEIVYGNSGHVIGTKQDPKLKSWPWPSYHSRVWRNETKKVLSEFIGELKRTGLSKRIVGVHLAGYHDAQFATACPDWSEPARKAFAASGEKDYNRFLKRAPMEIQDDFAHHIRAAFGKQIVMFRWCMAAFGPVFCSAHDIREFADSKEIDIIVPQPAYSYRSPGYAVGVKLPFASLHLNGKLLMVEHDLRTYASWPNSDNVVRDAGLSRATDIDEWRTIDRKMAGVMIARRTGFWYYDMENGWFDFPEIAEDIASIVRASRPFYLEKPYPWHPTAAFVIDEVDLIGLQKAEGKCLLAKADINLYVERIAASGVPFDVYMKGDWDRHPEIAARYPYALHYNRATPSKTPAEINAEAKAAGAYVPLPPNMVQVDMNGDFISVHCLVPGHYDFVLPRECGVVNMKSGAKEPVSGNILPLDLAAGQTSWFSLVK